MELYSAELSDVSFFLMFSWFDSCSWFCTRLIIVYRIYNCSSIYNIVVKEERKVIKSYSSSTVFYAPCIYMHLSGLNCAFKRKARRQTSFFLFDLIVNIFAFPFFSWSIYDRVLKFSDYDYWPFVLHGHFKYRMSVFTPVI